MKARSAADPFIRRLLAGVALAAGIGGAFATSPRHLFLDPAAVERLEGARLVVNPPRTSQLVITPDRPWEGLMISLYTTVIEEKGVIRLWYICRDSHNRPNLAYAESRDGVNWTKPNLGLVDYEGSRENNLVGVPSLDGAVFRDPHARPGEEYVYVGHVHGEGVFRYVSPDGLRWRRDRQALLDFRADTQNVGFWDARIGRYVLYLRGWKLADRWENRLRRVVRLTATTLAEPIRLARSGRGDNPTRPDDLPRIVDELPTVLEADQNDPPGTDVYNLSAQTYPLDPRWYVGFPSFFLRERHISDGRLEVHMVGSRDGIHWHRYDRSPYVRLGLADSQAANMVFIGPGIISRGDELWQFGTGFRNRHGEVEMRKERADGAIFRHVQRVDGFVSIDFDLNGGVCEMKPVNVTGDQLALNVDTTALGDLRVELRSPDGAPIRGYSIGDCDALRTNATGAVVTWRGRSSVTSLRGREVRIVFRGSRTKLYSFRFHPARGPLEGNP